MEWGSTPQHPTVPQSTPQYPTVCNSTLQIWGLQIGVVAIPPSIKWSADNIKLAFLSVKTVQNYKENSLRSAYLYFFIEIKNSVWFLYPLPPVKPSTLKYIVVPCTLKNSVYPVTGCPNKHGNSVTNSISSSLWISIVIPYFKSHNINMSARVYLWKR